MRELCEVRKDTLNQSLGEQISCKNTQQKHSQYEVLRKKWRVRRITSLQTTKVSLKFRLVQIRSQLYDTNSK